ncbi:benomyl/methotrexate resistance protein [Bipolaris maydis]|nr:benomyl/methotrexate resistance protein [Bipolaris maydis]
MMSAIDDNEHKRRYVNREKSDNVAYHGSTQPPEKANEVPELRNRQGNGISDVSRSTLGDGVNEPSGARVDPEKGRDCHVVDWDGPGDPQKAFVTFQICFLTFSVYIRCAIYTPGLQGVMKEFGVGQVPALLGLTLYVAGYGLGPVLWSRMSEVPQMGRLLLPVVFSVSFGMLLAFRFLTGFVRSPALATGRAIIADMFRPKKQAYALTFWGISAVCGPVLGPLVGGFAVMAKGWKWTIWETTWLSGFCFVLLFFCLLETSSTNILHRRAKRLRKLTGDDRFTCESISDGGKDDRKGRMYSQADSDTLIVLMVLIKPITLNFTELIVLFLNLYIAFICGLLYLWFESFPIVFEGIYHFHLGSMGLAFLGILIGFDGNGNIAPEKRMFPGMIGCFFVPICMFWFGWSVRADVHFMVPIVGSGSFGIAAFSVFQGALPYLSDAYPDSDLQRSAFGAGFPLFANAMYKKLGIDWASSLLGFLGIAFIPIPFALHKWGRQVRFKGKLARKDI